MNCYNPDCSGATSQGAEGDDDTDSEEDEARDMATLGFATWIVGLSEAIKKRQTVVDKAIANATTPVTKEHACRIVER